MKSKVLIAGASGMVGQALVNELKNDKNVKHVKNGTRDPVIRVRSVRFTPRGFDRYLSSSS